MNRERCMDPIIIEALLVRGEGEDVRVILEPYCLDFAVDDVIHVEELPLPTGIAAGKAIAARVTLRPGARLRHLGSADRYRFALWSREIPFALATRPLVDFELAAGGMKEREDAFFAARGLRERFS
jgi:hypothetical protein